MGPAGMPAGQAESGSERVASTAIPSPLPRTEDQVSASERLDLSFADITADVGLVANGAAYKPKSAMEWMSSGAAVTRLDGRLTILLTGPTGNPQLFSYDGDAFRRRHRGGGG